MDNQNTNEMNLAAPCGIYCGTCRAYLVLKKGLLEKRGYKTGCEGCRARNKNCVFIKKFCAPIRNKEINFCFECEKFPCKNRAKLDQMYINKYKTNLVENLRRLKEIGLKEWLKEQEDKWKCPKCGGNICVHDRECLDCGYKIYQT